MPVILRLVSSWQTWAVLVAVAAFCAHVTIVSDLRDQIRKAQATADGLRIQVSEQTAAIKQMRADADRRAARAACAVRGPGTARVRDASGETAP